MAKEGASSSACEMTKSIVEAGTSTVSPSDIRYACYEGEHQLPLIMNIVDQELSEPYSIFTYRYFITLWPHLCFLAFHEEKCVGTVVCKMGQHRNTFRGYIAMLVVIKPYRGKGIATELVTRSIQEMQKAGCEEVWTRLAYVHLLSFCLEIIIILMSVGASTLDVTREAIVRDCHECVMHVQEGPPMADSTIEDVIQQAFGDFVVVDDIQGS